MKEARRKKKGRGEEKGRERKGMGEKQEEMVWLVLCGEPDASLQHWVRVRTHCPELTLGLERTRQIPFIVNESWPLGLSFPKASN